MRVLFLGDIFGKPGRHAVRDFLPDLRAELGVDIVVANAENAAGGVGVTADLLEELGRYGVDAFTLGNHTWRRRAFVDQIDRFDNVVRPANYPPGAPGRGAAIVRLADGRELGLVNVLGRVYLDGNACPFETTEREVSRLREKTSTILVDVHAEATSEKVALGWFLDGTCSAVVGTHTHVQTADERILPKGTAYITDVGMTGPRDSVIGTEIEPVIERFRTGLPTEQRVSELRPAVHGVQLDLDDASGRARSIERIVRGAD